MQHRILSNKQVSHLDTVILTGGLGLRLRNTISDRPKTMAPIHNKPFLDLLITYLASFGLHRFILCTGYMSEYIENYYSTTDNPYEIHISSETSPLGTGGAVKNAAPLVQSNPFLVLNGDSLCRVALESLYKFHTDKQALLSIVLVEHADYQSTGQVVMDDTCSIVAFAEKTSKLQSAYSSAGVYLFEQRVLDVIPAKIQCSLEYDIFPQLIGKQLYGFLTDAHLIDIGTAEQYELAKSQL